MTSKLAVIFTGRVKTSDKRPLLEGHKFTSFCSYSVLPSLNKVYYGPASETLTPPGEFNLQTYIPLASLGLGDSKSGCLRCWVAARDFKVAFSSGARNYRVSKPYVKKKERERK